MGMFSLKSLQHAVCSASNNEPADCNRVATGQEMVREKIFQGQGNVGGFYFESGKIDILKKSQEKLK